MLHELEGYIYSRPKDDERRHPRSQAGNRLDCQKLRRIAPNKIVEQCEWELPRREGPSKASLCLDREQESLGSRSRGAEGLVLTSNRGAVELETYVEALPRDIERPVETDADVFKSNGVDETLVGMVSRNVRLLDPNGVTL